TSAASVRASARATATVPDDPGRSAVSEPRSVAEAKRMQEQLRSQVDLVSRLPAPPARVAGVDVSYDKDSHRVAAAAVLIELATLKVAESAVAYGEATFPYVPGLLAFREVPILVAALGKLTMRPDVLVCDGYGVAHPRGFGFACHLGVVTRLPTFGVAKTRFIATYEEPGPLRGDWSPLRDAGIEVGRAVRTQTNVK